MLEGVYIIGKNYDLLDLTFPDKLKNVDYKQFYNACNNVKSSLIRTNSMN